MNRKPNLVLIRGGAESLGPISRMGLWNRFPRQSKVQLAWLLTAKAVLIGSLIYYLFG